MFRLTVLLFGFIIFSSYCALLVSYLVVKNVDLPFNSLEGLAASDYILVMPEGATWQIFKDSHDPIMHEIFVKKIVPNTLTPKNVDYSTFGKKLLSDYILGLMMQNKVAIQFYNNYLAALEEYPCLVVNAPFILWKDQLALAYRKDSDLAELFDYFLLKLREGGQLWQLYLKYRNANHQNRQDMDCSSDPEEIGLGFSNVLSLFVLMAVGIPAAAVALIKEYLLFAKRRSAMQQLQQLKSSV